MTEFQDRVVRKVGELEAAEIVESRDRVEAEHRVVAMAAEVVEVLHGYDIATTPIWRMVQAGEITVPESQHHGLYGGFIVPAHTLPRYVYERAGDGWLLYREFMYDSGQYYEVSNLGITTDGRLFRAGGPVTSSMSSSNGQPMPVDAIVPDFIDNINARESILASPIVEKAVAHRVRTHQIPRFGLPQS